MQIGVPILKMILEIILQNKDNRIAIVKNNSDYSGREAANFVESK